MALTLIGDDQPITAALWNTLFQELDTKVATVLDNKNLLFVGTPSVNNRLLGMPFFWVAGPRLRSSAYGGRQYDHAPFTEAALELAYTVFDAERHIASIDAQVPASYRDRVDMANSTLFFDRSLEAHTVQVDNVPHWIIERAYSPVYRPEKIHKYAQAEIIVEGLDAVEIKAGWNKYNFFRIHNLNPHEIIVDFADGVHQVIIPRYQSRCVRRTTETTGYLEGYQYFHKFRTGDPRVFEMPHSQDTPHGSMGANNVISPAIAYHWIAHLSSGILGTDAPRFFIDPHQLYDVADLYSEHFPAIADNVLIGDLLHHRGTLRSVKITGAGALTTEDFEFEGYAELKAKSATLHGISVTENDDGSLSLGATDSTITHDLWAIGTNLLNTNGTLRPAVNLGFALSADSGNITADSTAYTADNQATGYTIENRLPTIDVLDPPGSANVAPMIAADSEDLRLYRQFSEVDDANAITLTDTVSIAYTTPGIESLTGFTSHALSLHQTTVAQVKSLDLWGSSEHPGQSTAYQTFENRNLTLTPFGLVLSFERTLPLARDIPALKQISNPVTIDAVTESDVALVGSSLVYSEAITFNGYGWPTIDSPAFISPRKPRLVTPLGSSSAPYVPGDLWHLGALANPVYHHPTVANQPGGGSGSDFTLQPLPKDKRDSEKTEAAILMPVSLDWPQDFVPFDNPFDFQVYPVKDVLPEYLTTPDANYAGDNRDRFLLNSYRVGQMIRLPLLREHFNCLANRINAITKCRPFTWSNFGIEFEGSLVTMAPNSTGPHGGLYRPADQYASFAKESATFRLCEALGIPIKTALDLPASYWTASNTLRTNLEIYTRWTDTTELLSTRTVPWFNNFLDRGTYFYYTYRITQTMGESVPHLEPLADSILTPATFGGADPSQEFYWVTVDDVQAKAEELGHLFRLERVGIPYTLKIYTLDSTPEHLHDRNAIVYFDAFERGPYIIPPPAPGSTTYTALGPVMDKRFALMTEATAETEAEWIRDPTSAFQIHNHTAGDRLTALHYPLQSGEARMTAGRVYGFTFPDSDRWLRQHSATSHIALNEDARFASVLAQSWISSELERNSSLILVSKPSIDHPDADFSGPSYRRALARLQYGAQVLPFVATKPEPSATAVPIANATTFQLGSASSARVLHFDDWPRTGL